MSVITFYGSYRIDRECKESDIEAYSLLATKQISVCGGEDYFQRWLDEDFTRQMTYHNVAARFHGGHYEEAGQSLGTLFQTVASECNEKILDE